MLVKHSCGDRAAPSTIGAFAAVHSSMRERRADIDINRSPLDRKMNGKRIVACNLFSTTNTNFPLVDRLNVFFPEVRPRAQGRFATVDDRAEIGPQAAVAIRRRNEPFIHTAPTPDARQALAPPGRLRVIFAA